MHPVCSTCDELKTRIEAYRPQDTDRIAFLQENCSADVLLFEDLFEAAWKPHISLGDILELHRKLFSGAPDAGALRRKRVYVNSNRAPVPAPEVLPAMMNSFVNRFNSRNENQHPIESAVSHLITFAYLYPFSTGTLEMVLVITNLSLIRAGYPPVHIQEFDYPKFHKILDNARSDFNGICGFVAERISTAETALLETLERRKEEQENSAEVQVFVKSGRVFIVEDDRASDPVYALISSTPGIRKPAIATALSMPASSVTKELARLKKAGMIEFRGLPKTGGYFVTQATLL